MPAGAYSLTANERKVFLNTLYELKVPSNFSSNLRRVVHHATNDLKQCKSHDWHVIMQLVPLLFGHCFAKHKDLRRAIMQISLCFTLLCAKVVNKKHIMAAKIAMAEATCVFEKYFPPSFFDISIHLLVHLCDEALQCGPVRYRWMYPFERLMKTFKDYVKNARYVEGSIAEEYITEEASIYAKEYIPNPFNETRECFVDDSEGFADEEALGNGKLVTLTSVQYEQAARYVFETHEDIDHWKEKYNASEPGKKRRRAGNTDNEFRHWVAKEIMAGSSSHQEIEPETPPISQGSAVGANSPMDKRPVITFNSTGQIIGNKKKLKARSLTLLKIQVGLEYDDWRQVEQTIKDDMWKTLSGDFIIPLDRKEDVLKEMGGQLRTWRWNTRNKYLKDLDATGILALKDKVPPKENIRVSQWNAFIQREATEKKLQQREVLKGNRANKNDVHCLGRTSYAQKSNEMKSKDPDRRSPTRSAVYLESRKQPKTGEVHPKVAETCQRVKELSSGQDSSSQVSLEDDALTRVLGKDSRGRTRGVGRVCKGKVKAVQPVKSNIEKVLYSNQHLEKVVYGMQDQISSFISAFNKSQNLSSPTLLMPQFSPQPNHGISTPSPSICPLATPSPTRTSQPTHVLIKDVVSTKVIAKGNVVPTLKGEKVHGRNIQDHESKLCVISVENDAIETQLYLGCQGCATTIGEVVGGFVVWPKCFLKEI